jgi:apolipoprotein N-acyltransferase
MYFYSMVHRIIQHQGGRWFLALLSGLLMIVSFPRTGSLFPLTFVAWIPLLLVEQFYVSQQKKSIGLFFQAYFTFLIYNIGTTWWIYFADASGAYMAFIANSLLMALAFLVYHLLHKKLGEKWKTLLFLSTWISFEFLHFNWELSWPWLTFGNVMATGTPLVQWYSITGVLGGSLWILLINVLLTAFILRPKAQRRRRQFLYITGILFIPMVISLLLYLTKNTEGKPFELVIIQPNVDPYHEKFNSSDQDQLNDLFAQINQTVRPNTQLIIAPETALYPNYNLQEANFENETYVENIREQLKKWHHADLLIGASTFKAFDVSPSSSARFDPQSRQYMERYNSSVLFSESHKTQVVHKSKLVLGVEKIPFNGIFPSLEKLAINLGGSSGSLGIENTPKIMHSKRVGFSPAVCYESIYGEFMSKQAVLGSEFIAIITNDGWWKDTPGYKQHFDFASLRAIENNRWVARSANTGKSGIINNRGDVLKETGWWKKDQFRFTIQRLQSTTIYQMTGDSIGYIALLGLSLFVVIGCWKGFMLRKETKVLKTKHI